MVTDARIHPVLLGPIVLICLIVIGFQVVDLVQDYTSGKADIQKRVGEETVLKSEAPQEYANLMRYQVVRVGLTFILLFVLSQLYSWYKRPATPLG